MATSPFHHAIEERRQQTVSAVGERRLAAVGFVPGQRVTESQKYREVGITFLEGLNYLKTAAANLRRVHFPGFSTGITLFVIFE